MNILYVCKSLPHTYRGGIQTHLWELSGQMLRFGHQVSILTAGSFRAKNSPECSERDMAGRHLLELPYLPGRHFPFMPTFAEEWAFNRAAAAWLRKNEHRFDLIHLQGRSGCLYLHQRQTLEKPRRAPVVNTLHGLIAIENGNGAANFKNWLDRRLHQLFAARLENAALENADALITVSDEMENQIGARNAALLAKTHRIYNGVGIPEIQATAPAEAGQNRATTLLFVGRLSAIKGVFPLVEAMKAVRKDVRLVMVGDGDARPELENIIRANGLSERITLTGSLDNAGVQGWLSRSAALVLPSFYESQGIVLMEANAAGLPVIAHRVGGVAEVVEHGKNGFLLENNQPHTIAQAVNALFSRPGLAKSMGQCGRLLVRQRFSWDRIALHTLVVYEGLLRQHQPYKATIGRAGRLEAAAQFPIFHPQPAVNF